MSNRSAAIVVLLFVLLGACGQKGDLYLRDDAEAPSSGQELAQQEQRIEEESADEEQDDED